MRAADWQLRNAICMNEVDGPPMESLELPPNSLNQRALTAATVIKPLHMPLQAGVPGRRSILPLLVPACFSMTVPEALNSTID